jgi:hypothetical protein
VGPVITNKNENVADSFVIADVMWVSAKRDKAGDHCTVNSFLTIIKWNFIYIYIKLILTVSSLLLLSILLVRCNKIIFCFGTSL